jgi:helix-turn-helix protein
VFSSEKRSIVTLSWRSFMARGRKTALTIRLAADERHTLMAWQRSTTIPAGRARRGRIILLVADGVPISHIADTVGISRRFVYKWAKRFLQYGVDGLTDKPGRGHRPLGHQPEMVHQNGASVG